MRKPKAQPPVAAPGNSSIDDTNQLLAEHAKLLGFVVNRLDLFNRYSAVLGQKVEDGFARIEAKLEAALRRHDA
jgi:hypothetical protein